MSKIDKLRKQNKDAYENAKGHLAELDKMGAEATRVADVARDVHIIIADLDRQFEKATGLTGQDVKFLFLATALQVVRQYVLTKFPERMRDHEAAEKAPLHHETHSERLHRYYNPSLDEIWSNPVPFDANIRSDGALSGGGTMGHRITALGHDPILGLVFGTANIATATLTNNRLESWHIASGGVLRNGTVSIQDVFSCRAQTPLVLIKTKDKLLHEGMEGAEKVGLSLLLEVAHLASDVETKKSLPIPVLPVINPQLASDLAGYGLDMANVFTIGKQAAYTVVINTFISMLHGLCCDELQESARKLYSVRTRKILMYSNTLAAASNVIAAEIMAACPATAGAAWKNLDIGGFMVAVYRIVKDTSYIKQIKQEFLEREFYDIVMG